MNRVKLKFCDDPVFKQDTYEALQSQFNDKNKFEEFYSKLKSNEIKDDFLRVGSAYLFFVKSGDWHVNVQRSNPVIGCFTNSFKLVAALSITEGLNNRKYVDFFEWLNKKENKDLFPIDDQKKLKIHYESYKREYGSGSNVKNFFSSLSEKTKAELCKLVTINQKEVANIEELIKLVYEARSNFAHSTQHTLEFSDGLHFAGTEKKRIVWKHFQFEYLLAAIEEGIVLHFKKLSIDI